MNIVHLLSRVSDAIASGGRVLQSPLLLALRVYWGWAFFQTGRGKLLHLDRTAEFFAGLSIPLPAVNAAVAGAVECVGGLLLLAGFATRLVSIPLLFTMIVAYATAERDAVRALFSNPDQFTSAAPFLFLLVVTVMFTFGPGRFSVDARLMRRNMRGSVVADHGVAPALVAGRGRSA